MTATPKTESGAEPTKQEREAVRKLWAEIWQKPSGPHADGVSLVSARPEWSITASCGHGVQSIDDLVEVRPPTHGEAHEAYCPFCAAELAEK